MTPVVVAVWSVAALLGVAVLAVATLQIVRGDAADLRRLPRRLPRPPRRRPHLPDRRDATGVAAAAARPALDRRAFPPRCAERVLPRRRQSRRRRREPLCARLRPRTRRRRGRVLPFYPAFLAGMNLVVLADDAFTFLVCLGVHVARRPGRWCMAHHREPENRARRLRLSGHGELRHAGAAARLRPARRPERRLRLRRDPRQRRTPPSRRPGPVLALLGAGSKAGLVPLHVWLPLAHPAAPSHVSALMSGVMTKVAVYGFIRIVFDLARPAGLVVEHRGHAARRHHRRARRALRADAARPQAAARLHTVENIGIIFIGLGLALAFAANGMPAAGGAGADRGAVSRLQPLAVQEPAVLRRRRRADGDRRARHGAPRRPDPPHAADRLRFPGRLRRRSRRCRRSTASSRNG